MARGWGWRPRAGWSKPTPAASRSKTARRARRRFALRSRNRSRLRGGGRLVPSENVHVDVLEQQDQGGGRIPGPPPATPAPQDHLGIQRLAQVAGERRGHISPVEADELAALAVYEGRVLAQPTTLRFREPRRADADHGELRGRACDPGRHAHDARLHPWTRRDAGDEPRARLPRLYSLSLAHGWAQAPIGVIGDQPKGHLAQRREDLRTELGLECARRVRRAHDLAAA